MKFVLPLAIYILTLYSITLDAQVPANVEPGQVEKRFESQSLEFDQSNQNIQIPQFDSSNSITDPLLTKPLSIKSINIVGSTVYSTQELDDFGVEFLTEEPAITGNTILQLAQNLKMKYASDGYEWVTVRPPLYGIDANNDVIVRLEVVEGFIGSVSWPESVNQYEDFFLVYEKQLKAIQPLDKKTFNRYLLLANDLPGLYLGPSHINEGSRPGAVALGLNPSSIKPWRAWSSLDNRGTDASGPQQVSMGYSYANIFGAPNQLSVAYSGTTDFGELHYGSLTYEQVINAEGTSLILNGTYSDGEPGTLLLEQLDYRSSGTTGSVELKHPLVRDTEFNWYVSGGYRYSDLNSDILSTVNSQDRLSVFRLNTSIDWIDRVFGGRQSQNFLNLTFHQGIDGLGSTENNNPSASRGDGRVDFSRLNLYFSRSQSLNQHWRVNLNIHGQYADDALLSSQECAYGGASFGRGFEPSIVVGDHCTMASLELVRHLAFPSEVFQRSQAYLVGDYGKLSQKGFDIDTEASSYGIGLRSTLWTYLDLQLEVVRPILDGYEDDQDWQVFFRVGVRI